MEWRVNPPRSNSGIMFLSCVCISKFNRSRSVGRNGWCWVPSSYTVFWRVHTGLSPLVWKAMSTWRTFGTLLSSLLQTKLSWKNYVLQDHPDANESTVTCCFSNVFLIRGCEEWSRTRHLWQLHGKDLPGQCDLRTSKRLIFPCVGVLV